MLALRCCIGFALLCAVSSVFFSVVVFVFEQVKAIEREKQEEERSQGQNEENRHATRHQVPLL